MPLRGWLMYDTASGPVLSRLLDREGFGGASVGSSIPAYRAVPGKTFSVRIALGGSRLEIEPILRREEALPVDRITGRARSVLVTGRAVKREGGGKRGQVKGFSVASRSRLRGRFGGLKRDEVGLALFVTLTYPVEVGQEVDCVAHLRAFLKRLRRRYPEAAAVWRKEWQKNGMPHYHLLVLGVPFIPWRWVAQAWYEVVGSGLEKHLQAGTEVRRVHSYRQACSYLEKYMGKVSDDPPEGIATGRLWGVAGALERYAAPVLLLEVAGDQAARLARVLDGLRRSWGRRKAAYARREAAPPGGGRRSRRRKTGWVTGRCRWYTDTWAIALNLEAICGGFSP